MRRCGLHWWVVEAECGIKGWMGLDEAIVWLVRR